MGQIQLKTFSWGVNVHRALQIASASKVHSPSGRTAQ